MTPSSPTPMVHEDARRWLVDRAAAPYRAAGRFAWHFARGKLGGDPVFTALLERGLVPRGARILDLGCGQGLLGPWLAAAGDLEDAGGWPARWAQGPGRCPVHGIELMARDVERARRALGPAAPVFQGDIRTAAFPSSDAVVILDVLHYVALAEQEAVLARAREALPPGGTLLLRVGDAGAGWRYRASQWVDAAVTLARGHRAPPVHGRVLRDWLALLERLGLPAQAVPMSEGTPFANVLLVGRRS